MNDLPDGGHFGCAGRNYASGPVVTGNGSERPWRCCFVMVIEFDGFASLTAGS